jgi:hypothetical protein
MRNESVPARFINYLQNMLSVKSAEWLRSRAGNGFGRCNSRNGAVRVRSEYEKAGLKLADDVRVVCSQYFVDGKIPGRFRNSYAYIYLYGGIALSALLAFLLALRKIQLG